MIIRDVLQTIFIDFTRDALLWLDNWPEGLKLNTELSSFLLHVFLGVLGLWACEYIEHVWFPSKLSFAPPPDILRSLSPHFPTILFAIGLSGYGGLTVPLSLFLDLFNALTLHVSLSYLALKKALSYQTYALGSLWNLFRGQPRLL